MVGIRIPLGKPVFDQEMEEAALESLRNERFVLGESVRKFEEEFARYCGVEYAVSTSSGTNALQIALMASGLKAGESVVTSPASFIASANAIIHAQGQPVFSDINLSSYTLDPKPLSTMISSNVKAIIPVHLYGYPADMNLINTIAEKKKLVVIEDCCQAHGALYNGNKTGSLGAVGCFSFYPSKNMTVGGDGGMIVTSDKKIAEKSSKLRDCGRKSQYVHDMIGYTSRLNTVNASIGRVQLKRLDQWNKKRREIAKEYFRNLGDISDLVFPLESSPNIDPVFHLFVIRTKLRDELKEWLESCGVGCGIHYALPIHLQPIYQEMFSFKEGSYPNSEELCKTCLSLPIYPDLELSEVKFISEKIHDYFNKKR